MVVFPRAVERSGTDGRRRWIGSEDGRQAAAAAPVQAGSSGNIAYYCYGECAEIYITFNACFKTALDIFLKWNKFEVVYGNDHIFVL